MINNGDLIQTLDSGKVRLTLLGGDQIFLAPDTEVMFEENAETKGIVRIIKRNLGLMGLLLARIKKNLARPVKIRTPNAVVGVKGTEFVVEFIKKVTNVGTRA